MDIHVPNRLSLARLPTPFHLLTRLTESLGGPRVWIKRDDLTGTAMSGNKLRKLEFVVAEAVRQGSQVLITSGGIQSNHCRTTAVLCAQLGLTCHLLLRGDKPNHRDGNALLAYLVGASTHFIEPAIYQSELNSIFAKTISDYADRGLKAYAIPTGASDEVGLWGYYCMAEELLSDFRLNGLVNAAVCCATGSGGTHAGLALGLHHQGYQGLVRGYAVCDDRSYFINKGHADMIAWHKRYCGEASGSYPDLDVNDDFIGAGYGVVDDDVIATIKHLATLEGVLLDPVYTGKAFHGMLTQIRAGQFAEYRDVVFIHTGGIFGLFPYRNQLCNYALD